MSERSRNKRKMALLQIRAQGAYEVSRYVMLKYLSQNRIIDEILHLMGKTRTFKEKEYKVINHEIRNKIIMAKDIFFNTKCKEIKSSINKTALINRLKNQQLESQ